MSPANQIMGLIQTTESRLKSGLLGVNLVLFLCGGPGLGCAPAAGGVTAQPRAQPGSEVAAPVPGRAVDPEADVPEGWLEGALAEDEVIDLPSARSFVEAVFALVGRKIFDPAYKDGARAGARLAALASIEARNPLTRREVVASIDAALKATGMSHLRLIGPENGRKVFAAARSSAPGDRGPPAVAIERQGPLAIVRVRSFLVPQITRPLVEDAMRRAQGAAAILLDLRGNAGGSTSSRVLLSQYLLGPDRTVTFFRGRSGAGRLHPFVQRGSFPDEDNQGSEADVALNEREGFVEWRTSLDAPPPLASPVYLLVDGACGSACDSFAAAMKDHHAATLLGVRTMGHLLSASAFMTSWKGFLAFVPIGMELSPLGQVIEGVGVPPDVEIPDCGAASEERRAACLPAALGLISEDLARGVQKKPAGRAAVGQ